jgi:hypothetical protein
MEAPPVLVFSYGSNNARQLAGRVVAAGEPPLPPPRGAVLHGFARTFARHSANWCAAARTRAAQAALMSACLRACRGGGVADVVRAEGHAVHGALCTLTAAQAARLDAYERGYDRTLVRVALAGAPPGARVLRWRSVTPLALAHTCTSAAAQALLTWRLLRTLWRRPRALRPRPVRRTCAPSGATCAKQ